MKNILLILLVLVLGGLFVVTTPEAMYTMGSWDLRGYWSASYLLGHSENFTDPDLLLEVQQQLTGHLRDYPIMAWNPPWLMVLLLPLTIVPFAMAIRIWLLFNITVIFAAAIICWRVFEVNERDKRLVIVAPLIAFTFHPTLITLLMGQVNTLVLLGLIAFLYLWRSNRLFLAGMALSLTMVKPHLVYITLPLCLLQAFFTGRRRVLTGFVTALIMLTATVFVLRPTFISDYFGTVLGAQWLSQGQVPTVSVALAIFTGWDEARYLGIIILPFTLFLWHWKYRHSGMPAIVSAGTIISLATAPFGWSYDQVLLIIPIIQIVLVALKMPSRLKKGLFAFGLIAINGYSFYLRIAGNDEFVFFWLSPAVGLLYWLALMDPFARTGDSRTNETSIHTSKAT